MTTEQSRIESVLTKALEIESPQVRQAFIHEACAGCEQLRLEVERLLDAHFQAGRFLESPAIGNTAEAPSIGERPGMAIGHYKLLQQIGEGGFGVVFMAEQQEPVVRKVALKIIKPGMDSREVIARFEGERQALALMDHPSIARIFDGGTTESGRPYFVMELVRGVPITEYCDDNNLSPAQRMELFISVCQAVQHAHQKGIIHRDIKPSNVLVTLHDGDPVVKIIDFGVAKALNQRLTQRTLFTQFAGMVGTPLYMSPEQAAISGLDIDTRSDVYSLGVLLYELLTGSTPLEKDRLQQVAYDEIRRIIREEEPPRPSVRLSSLGGKATTVTSWRGTDVSKLAASLRGDLDWIVMKALEKNRNRRYDTAKDLAQDIRRHLGHEPVTARRPSALYLAQKFVQRHKYGLSIVGLLIVVAMVGIGVTVWQKIQQNELKTRSYILSQNVAARKLLDAKQLEDAELILAELYRSGFDQDIETTGTMMQLAEAYATRRQSEAAFRVYENARPAYLRLRDANATAVSTIYPALVDCYRAEALTRSNIWTSKENLDQASFFVQRLKEIGGISSGVELLSAWIEAITGHTAEAQRSLERSYAACGLGHETLEHWRIESIINFRNGNRGLAQDWFLAMLETGANYNSYQSFNSSPEATTLSGLLGIPNIWPPEHWTNTDTCELFTRLLNVRPHSALLHSRLGASFARGGKWDSARAEYAKALELAPRVVQHRMGLAAVLIHLNDPTAYQQLCQDTLHVFASTTLGAWEAREVVLLCCVKGDAGIDYKRLEVMLESSALNEPEFDPGMGTVRGMLAYRQTDWARTDNLARDAHHDIYTAGSMLFRAMANIHLGKPDEATLLLQRAEEYIRQTIPSYDEPPTPCYETCVLWCFAQEMLREAKETILAPTGDPHVKSGG